MTQFCPEFRTHAQRVCRLYKEGCRQIESYYDYRPAMRYQQVLLRARFDKNSKVADAKEMRRLLFLGEEELFSLKHPIQVMKFPRSQPGIAGGVAWDRVVNPPDWVFDYWHPYEKDMYPDYFRTREKRKCEYIRKWYTGEIC